MGYEVMRDFRFFEGNYKYMKNVLQILSYAAPYRGNFIPSLEHLENAYKDGRMIYLFPVTAQNVSWMPIFQQEHKVYFMPNGFFGKQISWAILKKLREIIKEEDIKVIHTHFLVYNYSLFVAKHTFARKIKMIAHIHNQFAIPSTKSAPIKKFVMEHSYDTIIGVSKSVADGLNRQIKHKNITYINNAICFSRLDAYEKISLRENENQKVVLMAGWPALVKGVDIAAQAILELRNDGCDIKLCIMQSGDFEQTQHCVTEAIGSYPDWVEILPPREDVATYYNAADIFLSASRTEAFSYCLVEAAYCTPMLITSDIPGPSDLKIDGMEKFVSEDVEDLAHKMKELLVISMDVEERKYNVIRLYELRHWAEAIAELY